MVDEALGSEAHIHPGAPGDRGGTSGVAVAPHGFAVRYAPADLAGHWHDVVLLDDGRVGVVLGRCAEADLAPRCRSAARSVLLATADPIQALDGVAELATSALCAVIDGEKIGLSSRGDSNAAVTAPGNEYLTLNPAGAEISVVDLTPGATVLLCTAPLGPAAPVLDDCGSVHPEQVADQVMNRFAVPGVAAVLYRHPPEPLSITLAAEPANLAVSRGRLRRWLESAGVGAEVCADVLLAVGEATANATEHAVVGAARNVAITVTAALNAGRLSLTVSDTGVWKPPPDLPGDRGHGIPLINALVDSADMATTPEGTKVEMIKELRP